MRITKTIVSGTVLALAFLANCDLILGPSWSYDEADMRAAVEGTWKLTRNSETITLVAKQATGAAHSSRDAGLVHAASACGSRSFVRQAAACGDVTRMPLEMIAEGHELGDAELMIASTEFESGELRFEIDGASVSASVDPTGAVKGASLWAKDHHESVTLQRVAK